MNKIISRKRTLQIIVILCILGVTIYGLRFIDFKQVLQQVEKLPFFLKAITMILFIMLQVVFALLPGEPLELASGFLFGNFYGTLLCLAGSCLGTFFVYYLVMLFKHKIINLFFSREKVQEVEQMLSKNKSKFWIFLIFLVPGSPKDILTYVASLGNINLVRWLIMTTLGRIPSILTSTYLSASLKEGDIISALIVLLLTIAMVILGGIYYRYSVKKSNA